LPWGALAPFLCLVLVLVSDVTGSLVLERFHLVDARGRPLGFAGFLLFLLVGFTLMGLVFLSWIRLVERRPIATIGLGGRHRLRTFLAGHAIGLATISAVVAAIGASGGFAADGYGKAFGSWTALASIGALLVCFAVQSSVEEIVFRGWLLSGVARKLGVPIAVLLTSAVFTLLHYGPKQHWATTTSNFLFSVFTCAWALRAGSIWGVMGWHSGWNWLLAVGFELPVTGLDAGVPALLVKLVPRGSVLLNGGTQGPEGSLWCNAFFVAGTAFLLWRSRRQAPNPLAQTREVETREASPAA
jgi:membrane protease YdiL (CAAX protease family)